MATCLGCFAGTRAPTRAPGRPQKLRVELNVGGHRFCTSRATLAGRSDSLLAQLIEGEPDEDGVYFLDRDGRLFGHVLNFLRDGPQHFLVPASEQERTQLRREAEHLGLPDLVQLIDEGPPAGAAGSSPSNSRGKAKGDSAAPICTPAVYQGAGIPCNELQRLNLLDSLEILYSSREHHFDCISAIVAALLEVPIVLVSLVAKEEQWFKAKLGVDVDSTPRNTSFCAFMFKPEIPQAAAMLVVEDALRDPRVVDNPLVIGEPYIRFYAGCPLVTSSGLRLGALCAIDRIPRALSPSHAQLLVNFGQLTSNALERGRLVQAADQDGDDSDEDCVPVDFAAGKLREQRMRDSLSEMVVLVWVAPDSQSWPLLYASRAWTEATGIRVTPPSRFPGPIDIADLRNLNRHGTSLWDHFSLASCSAKKFESLSPGLWTVIRQQDGTTRVDQPTFALSGTLNTGSPGGLNVLCRFSPADVPLDVAAAAIRPASQVAMKGCGIQPKGFSPGLLYFAVMVRQSGQRLDPVQEPAPAPQAAVPVLPRPAPPSKVHSGLPASVDHTASWGDVKRLDLSHLRKMQSEPVVDKHMGCGGDKPAGTSGARPPASPYEDVKLLRLAGEGSFGKVYFGLWNGTAVAVKVICNLSNTHQKLTLSPDVEAELSSLISHPNLVKTYQYSTRMVRDDNIADNQEQVSEKLEMWIVQEWCNGGTLREYCKQPRMDGADIVEVLEIGSEIASGIAYLHDRNIIHGDLTPNNVMLQSQPTRKGYICKVCDFGRARICDAETQEIMTRTMGTVTHMPPELFVTNIDSCCMTPKADVYALGVILYEVVTAKCPFAGLSPPQVVLRVATGKRLELPKEVPKELMSVYLACVSRDPKDRPTSHQLIGSLKEFHSQCLAAQPPGAEASNAHRIVPTSAPPALV